MNVTTTTIQNGGYIIKNTKTRPKTVRKTMKSTTGGAKHKGEIKTKASSIKPIASSLTSIFLGMLNTVKLYHWKTYSYAQHVATDELYEKLNKHIDEFMEIYLGKKEGRLSKLDKKISIIHPKNLDEMKEQLYMYRNYLISMNKVLDEKRDTDLLNVRDEILGDINKVLYLFTFK